MRQPANYADYRAIARRRLPHFLFEYFDGAAFDGVTATRNERELREVRLRQRVLRDVPTQDLSTNLFGCDLTLPLILSPVGLAGMAARRGEVQAARAARDAGVALCLSSSSICPIDEVARVAPPWFQLYMTRDPAYVDRLIDRAQELQSPALVVTVDLPMLGIRWRDQRSGFVDPGPVGSLRRGLQMLRRPRWAMTVGLRGRPHVFGNVRYGLGGKASMAECQAYLGACLETRLGPQVLARIRKRWPGPLVVKGILDPRDAEIALGEGVDGIIVSNHGGRQLDGAISSIAALPAVAETVGGRVPVLFDGGVRSGIDVIRALCLGASAVMAGRPWVWALAAGGEAGVRRMIAQMAEEARIAMALCGAQSIAQLQAESA